MVDDKTIGTEGTEETGVKQYKMRSFVIHNEDGTEQSTFTGYLPRQAALKAASKFGGTVDNPVELKLRERGSKKLHVYKAWKEIIDAPEKRPAWLPEKINRAFVDKLRIEHLEKKVASKKSKGSKKSKK